KWRFGSNHGEVDLLFFRESEQSVHISRLNRHAIRDSGDPGISGRAVQSRHQRARGERPRQRVFASARSNEKDVHRSIPAGTNPNGLYHRGMSDETPLNGAAETAPKSNIREFTVTELSNLLKRTVED